MQVTVEFQEWTKMDPFTFEYIIGFDKPLTKYSYKLEAGSYIWDLNYPLDVHQAEHDTLRMIIDNLRNVRDEVQAKLLLESQKRELFDMYNAFKKDWLDM